MMRIEVTLATPADDAAIRGLLRREVMPGRIQIAYEREPEFWPGCRVTGDDCHVLVARAGQDREVVGVACRSSRQVFVNGRQQRLGYLGQLRIDSRFRGRWLVSRGFSQLKQLHERDPLPGYLASIVDRNEEAAGVLVHHRRQAFPAFHPVADYCTLAIGVQGARARVSTDVDICAPTEDEYAAVAELLRTSGAQRQFFPVWTEDSLRSLAASGLRLEDLRIARRGGEIVGVAGLWDQSAYKQTVIYGYSGWLKTVAPVYNLGAPLLRRAALPKPGDKLRSAYAALISIANDQPEIFRALLRDVYNLAAARRVSYLLVGLDSRDPLLPLAKEYAHVMYPSRLYLAAWDGRSFYEQLDERPAYVDIATL